MARATLRDAWGLFAFGTLQTQSGGDLRKESVPDYESLGLGVQVSCDVRVGAAVHESNRALRLDTGGSDKGHAQGLDFFVSYEPSDFGLRVQASATVNHLSDTILRNYMNGSDIVTSEGKPHGRADGGSLFVGWELSTGDNSSALPFASYDVLSIAIDPFAETTGPFPASFDSMNKTAPIARLGAEERIDLTSDLTLWASADYAHNLSPGSPSVSGVAPSISLPFLEPVAATESDWAEYALNARWRLWRALELHLRLTGASSDSSVARFGGAVGIAVPL